MVLHSLVCLIVLLTCCVYLFGRWLCGELWVGIFLVVVLLFIVDCWYVGHSCLIVVCVIYVRFCITIRFVIYGFSG